MNELKVIEYQNQRILTTQQLAESYEAEAKVISNNFNRNKERYQEGKHYFCLERGVKLFNSDLVLNGDIIYVSRVKTIFIGKYISEENYIEFQKQIDSI